MRARLLLHPGFRAERTDDGLMLSNGSVRARLCTRLPISLEQGWWSPEFNSRMAAVQIVMDLGAAPCEGGFILEELS